MKKLSIIGASGHGRVVAEIAKLNGYDEIEFYDDNESLKTCGQYPVVGNCRIATKAKNDTFVAIGNANYRKAIMTELAGRTFPCLIHPSAVISEDVIIGAGTVIMAGAIVNPGVRIGTGCILNTCSSVDHDCIVGDFVHVAVGAHLCGSDNIGPGTWVGAGVTIINNVNVCGNCLLGAGAVVVKDIKEVGTYIGVPARKMENK